MRRAVFGGSFDPPHNGHINLVKQIYGAVLLNEVIVMPTKVSPFKQNSAEKPADGRQRYEMCRLAFANMPHVRVSDHEIVLPEVSYTVNTLRYLKGLYPNDELFFIMGSDMLTSFEKWYKFEEILSLCTIIAASRESGQRDISMLEAQARNLEKYGKVMVVPTSVCVMSSTEIRKKIKKSSDISCYMPQNVVKYILEHNLYSGDS